VSDTGLPEARRGYWSSLASLVAASGTLVCCAIPALLVALGAGAALSSLVAVFPQVVWLSENKALVFGAAAVAIAFAGAMQWRQRHAPCPAEPRLRDACLRTRRFSSRMFAASVACLAVGAWFAFVQPALSATG
jgi:hypothetical protein